MTDRQRDSKHLNVVEEIADGGDYSGLKYSVIYRGKATDINRYRLHLPEIDQKELCTIMIMIKYCLDSKIQKTAIFVIINNTMTLRTDKMLMFSYAHAFREITWEKCPVECHRIGPFKKLNRIIFRN